MSTYTPTKLGPEATRFKVVNSDGIEETHLHRELVYEPANPDGGPFASQLAFHASPYIYTGYSGPIGSGKSSALANQVFHDVYANPGCMGILGAPDYGTLSGATLPKLLEILDYNKIPYEHRSSTKISSKPTVFFPEVETTVVLEHCDQPDHLRGKNAAFICIDELTYMSPEAWKVLEGRLREPRAQNIRMSAVWTPKGHDWVWEKFRKDAIRDTKHGMWVRPNEEGKVTYALVMGKPGENTQKNVQDMYARTKFSYDPLFFRQEVEGEYINILTGRIYHTFSSAIHVSEKIAYNPHLPIHWAWDFNVAPMCSVICQRATETGPKSRQFYVVDEIVMHDSSTENVMKEFIRRYGPNGTRMKNVAGKIPICLSCSKYYQRDIRHDHHMSDVFIYGDATGGSRDSTSGISDYDVMRNFWKTSDGARDGVGNNVGMNSQLRLVWGDQDKNIQFRVPRKNPGRRERYNSVNAMCESADGRRSLGISTLCTSLAADLDVLQYKPGTSEPMRLTDADRGHSSDALGYVIHYLYPVDGEPTGFISGKNLLPLILH